MTLTPNIIKTSPSSDSLASTAASSISSSPRRQLDDHPKTPGEKTPTITVAPTSSHETLLGALGHDLRRKSEAGLSTVLSTVSGAANTVADFTVRTGKEAFKAGDKIIQAVTPPSNINHQQAAKADKILSEALGILDQNRN